MLEEYITNFCSVLLFLKCLIPPVFCFSTYASSSDNSFLLRKKLKWKLNYHMYKAIWWNCLFLSKIGNLLVLLFLTCLTSEFLAGLKLYVSVENSVYEVYSNHIDYTACRDKLSWFALQRNTALYVKLSAFDMCCLKETDPFEFF